MVKMSIHRALAEIKLLDKRINKNINESVFVGVIKGSEKKVAKTNSTKEDFKNESKASLESIQALIRRRNTIKSLIVESNANTTILIAGITYTVAAAIERKSSIELEEQLLYSLKNSYASAKREVERLNLRSEEQLNVHITTILGKDTKNMELIKTLTEEFRKDNTYEIVTGLDIEKTINAMEEDIENFKMEVDYILSTSNSLQEIEID